MAALDQPKPALASRQSLGHPGLEIEPSPTNTVASGPANVLVQVHGMVPTPQPSSPFPAYEELWSRLVQQVPQLGPLFPEQNRIGVQWGHELPDATRQIRPDEKITQVQRWISERIAYRILKKNPSDNNVIMSGVGRDWGIPGLRHAVIGVRESIIQHGLADVVFYTSADGERQVRSVVYGQVLAGLEPHRDAADVRLHLLGHSLGVTLTHDLLYGLFGRLDDVGYVPGFVRDVQGSDEAVERFGLWRERARVGSLSLGSLTSAASQLPIFLMRKQDLIDRIYDGTPLDPTEIGVTATGHIQWQLFYDIDDLLAMSTRDLYSPADAIREVQVDSRDWSGPAHTRYWENSIVVARTAELIHARATAAQ